MSDQEFLTFIGLEELPALTGSGREGALSLRETAFDEIRAHLTEFPQYQRFPLASRLCKSAFSETQASWWRVAGATFGEDFAALCRRTEAVQ